MLKKQLTYKPTVGDGLPNGRGREQGHRGAPALGPAEGERTPEHMEGRVPEPPRREQGRRGAPAPRPAEGERSPERTVGTRATGEGAGTSRCTSTGVSGGRVDT